MFQRIGLILLSELLLNFSAGDVCGQLQLIATQQKKPQPGTVQFKNGLQLSGMCSKEGLLNPDAPGMPLELRMVDQRARQIFSSNRQADVPVVDQTQWPVLTFAIPQKSVSHDA